MKYRLHMRHGLLHLTGLAVALAVCATTGIAASLPFLSVEESSRSRNFTPWRNLIALARSMTCGKSTFHGCGGTYGHFVM